MRLRPILIITMRNGRRLSNSVRFGPAIARWSSVTVFRQLALHAEGRVAKHAWLWALRGRLGVIGYLRLRFARFGSHAGERG